MPKKNEVDETVEIPLEPQEGTEETPETPETPEEDSTQEQDTFPRAYVEKLRKENADHRAAAKRADDLAAALWSAQVTASGRLADPTDLPLPDGVDPMDADAVETAVEELLERKPHLASRVPRGSAGQGATAAPEEVSLAGILASYA